MQTDRWEKYSEVPTLEKKLLLQVLTFTGREIHPRFLFKLALVLGVPSPLVLIISVAAKCVQWSTVQLTVQLTVHSTPVQSVPAGGRCQRVQCPQSSVKPAVTRGGRYSGEQTRHFCLRPSLAASGAVRCCQHSPGSQNATLGCPNPTNS